MDRPVLELALSALAAGLGIGFSLLATALLSAHVAAEYHPLVAALAYPLGFIYVVLARHQLFTENTVEPVIPVLEMMLMHRITPCHPEERSDEGPGLVASHYQLIADRRGPRRTETGADNNERRS